jgi:MerR family transcriptional regulator, heat shock protein HspR
MILAVAEMYEIHPHTLRLHEREGLPKPSRNGGRSKIAAGASASRLSPAEMEVRTARRWGWRLRR